MELKPDWEKVKKRYLAFWAGEIYDRVLFSITVPGKKKPAFFPPDNPEKRFTDSHYLVASCLAQLENTLYLADALPVLDSSCGLLFPDCLFGVKIIYGQTIWTKPVYSSCRQLLASVGQNFSSPLLKKQEQHLRKICNQAKGKCLVMMPPLTAGLDCLASLLGAEKLCLEMMDCPDLVKKVLLTIDEAFCFLHHHFYHIIMSSGVEPTGFLPLWSPEEAAVLQCDFSNLISPSLFETFVLPSLNFCSQKIRRVIFHLDGIPALRHLPALVSCEKVQVIQWQPRGPKRIVSGVERWLPLFQKIQKAGRKLYVFCHACQVELVLTTLSSRNLFLETEAEDIQQACYLEKLAFKLTHD